MVEFFFYMGFFVSIVSLIEYWFREMTRSSTILDNTKDVFLTETPSQVVVCDSKDIDWLTPEVLERMSGTVSFSGQTRTVNKHETKTNVIRFDKYKKKGRDSLNNH